MSKKLWGGRFKKKTDPLVEEFTKSIDYDCELALFDIIGSKIHVEVLRKCGYLEEKEEKELIEALDEIFDEVKDQMKKDTFKPDGEDIHTYIQNKVEDKVDDLALKLHTARSRNDQVLFDLKCLCKSRLLGIKELCSILKKSLVKVSESNKKVIIPGYTHLQHAQLIYLSDYLDSYVEMLQRDQVRLDNVAKDIKISLGAGALSGAPGIERKAYKEILKESEGLKKLLGAEVEPSIAKSIDTVSDRDFVIEILSALSILGMHLSRLSEDLIIWSTKEFGFIEIDDAFTTGSSLMPQKKNPDVLELIRGYAGTLYGNLMSVLTMMKGLPLTYNRDMQLDKPPLFSSFKIIEKELGILPGLIETIKWNKEFINEKIKDDIALYATDFVYYLIEKEKIPFKAAHDIIGKLVSECLKVGGIKKLSAIEIKKIYDKLDKKKLIELMDPVKSVKSRTSVDGWVQKKLKT